MKWHTDFKLLLAIIYVSCVCWRQLIVQQEDGALVQWLKLPAWKVGDRGLESHSDLQISKKQNVSSPLTCNDSILWGAFVTER